MYMVPVWASFTKSEIRKRFGGHADSHQINKEIQYVVILGMEEARRDSLSYRPGRHACICVGLIKSRSAIPDSLPLL